MNSAVEFEKAIRLTGCGKFHNRLMATCALVFLSVGFQNGLLAYVLPVAQCDLGLSSAEMGYLNVSFLVGGICSALLWGLLADIWGRRVIIIFTLFIDWAMGVGASLSQNFISLAVFRFFNGFFIGAPGTLAYTYLAEFYPAHKQSRSACIVGFFFAFSWIVLPAVAWVIVPMTWEYRFHNFVFNSWRLFILFVSFGSLSSAVLLINFPESPKYLLTKGDTKQALVILKYVFSKNTGKTMEEFPVRYLIATNAKKVAEYPENLSGPVGVVRIIRIWKLMYQQIKSLFSTPHLKMSILTSVMLCTNMFGFYGLGLWLPEIFSRFEEYSILFPNKTETFCEIQDILNNLTESANSNDCFGGLDNMLFLNTMVMGACCSLGNIISSYLAGKIDRRILPVLTMLVGGTAAALILCLYSERQLLVVASIFQAAMSTSNNAINSVVIDLFPTKLSAIAICTVTLAGRLGAGLSNLSFGILLDQSCAVPIFVVSATLIAGGVCGVFIPKGRTKAAPFEDEKKNEKTAPIQVPEISVISSSVH